ncbi:MAG: riboflavin biosynthesis protein RibF [Deferribacteraceae bacterium]|jgi:riboflavin kinase/FMN adenylyltransferase|nr:riboflavin biosynthesis protein RibF [Deferribacteraceae bacterium]
MKVIHATPHESIAGFTLPIVTAIGNFDGVHLGHKYLIEKMRECAESMNAVPAAATFDPLPSRFFGGDTPMITTIPQRLRLISQLGVEICLILDFNACSTISPEEFLKLLLNFGVKAIAVGKDFRFGRERVGDVELLSKICSADRVKLLAVDKLTIGGVCASSSHIRTLARQGKVEEIPTYLGRYLSLSGVVAEGDKLGRSIGFPTANLRTENELIPPAGVYGGRAVLEGGEYKALIYIGVRPTISGNEMRVEVNLQNFPPRDIYGEAMELKFTQRLRSEMKFANLEELKKQIIRDQEKL